MEALAASREKERKSERASEKNWGGDKTKDILNRSKKKRTSARPGSLLDQADSRRDRKVEQHGRRGHAPVPQLTTGKRKTGTATIMRGYETVAVSAATFSPVAIWSFGRNRRH